MLLLFYRIVSSVIAQAQCKITLKFSINFNQNPKNKPFTVSDCFEFGIVKVIFKLKFQCVNLNFFLWSNDFLGSNDFDRYLIRQKWVSLLVYNINWGQALRRSAVFTKWASWYQTIKRTSPDVTFIYNLFGFVYEKDEHCSYFLVLYPSALLMIHWKGILLGERCDSNRK